MLNIRKNVKLANYSTMGVGGDAEYLVVVKDSPQLLEALNWAMKEKLGYIVIGGGSNVLFSDEGFKGLVIINRACGFEIRDNVIVVESGFNFRILAKKTIDLGLGSLFFGSGIPGTIGGAIIGNAGALGYEISNFLVSVKVWSEGKVSELPKEDLSFSYRNSALKGRADIIVIEAKFLLPAGDPETTKALIDEDLKRRAKSYVGRTCGSYFKNPLGGDKSAGELIDALGLKGYRIGGAEVSSYHANVIRNVDNATAADIISLEQYIIQMVKKEFGITLESEVVKVGFSS